MRALAAANEQQTHAARHAAQERAAVRAESLLQAPGATGTATRKSEKSEAQSRGVRRDY